MTLTGSQHAYTTARAGVARAGAARAGFLLNIWTPVVPGSTAWTVVR